jgi:hypothetical protein
MPGTPNEVPLPNVSGTSSSQRPVAMQPDAGDYSVIVGGTPVRRVVAGVALGITTPRPGDLAAVVSVVAAGVPSAATRAGVDGAGVRRSLVSRSIVKSVPR